VSTASPQTHETSWSETILRLPLGEPAPIGYEIKRVLGHYTEPTGSGTNFHDIYVVACRVLRRE
jgi:hypothetical protein